MDNRRTQANGYNKNPSGDKAQWIRQMFASLKNRFERVEMLVWFDVNKECDRRMASSPQSLNAFRNAGA